MDTVQAQRKDKSGAQETGVKRNIINGFDATGICSINPDKVLNKIPNFSYNPEQEINDSLSELLRKKRFGCNNVERVRRKRQRLNVIPGKA
ncbi:hypothetical protein NQ314_003287 [Rhamnusium bicolor]|uniref:Uncharacterized protein n=1 Tax=Rhamnusium bicolor TaxID=1586634 RepID=A0AAV8ZPC4_9CUCU|nr:hypothetical protein NQ314_003287 [Rhamnusium bicolor]